MQVSLKIIIKDNKNWLEFKNPNKIYSAKNIDEISGIIKELDGHINAGKYIAGYISYEAAPAFDIALSAKKLESFPLLIFGVFDSFETLNTLNSGNEKYHVGKWQASQSAEYYNSNISRIKNYISLGETYQVNYTLRLTTDFSGSTESFFYDLSQNQKTDYSAYIEHNDVKILSVSPELFFELDGDDILSKPMKGTTKRGLSFKQDIRQSEFLKSSKKECAENLMITDMIRNDLGKICIPGSVNVPKLFETHKFPTAWQMTSDVVGKTTATFSEILTALFPCASITGAPKARSMQIINELEQTPRKIYTGTIGYFGPNRKARFNVAIRTVLIDHKKGLAEYGVGGGIVWDSVDKNEYEECKVKAKVLTQHQPKFDLLETMLLKNGNIFLLDYHLKRIRQLAQYFDYRFDEKYILSELQKVEFEKDISYRIRLLADKDGKVTIFKSELGVLKEYLNVGVALMPINSEDVFHYHKTTHRQVYNPAKMLFENEGWDDAILWNERNEITESVLGNIIVEMEGKLFTPPIKCGLLNGVYRQYLLEEKEISGRIILKDELQNAESVWLINSVRKKQKVIIKK